MKMDSRIREMVLKEVDEWEERNPNLLWIDPITGAEVTRQDKQKIERKASRRKERLKAQFRDLRK